MAVVGYSGDFGERKIPFAGGAHGIPPKGFSDRLLKIGAVEGLLKAFPFYHDLFGKILTEIDSDKLRACNERFDVTHPLEVALLFAQHFEDYTPQEIIAACAHDLAEDKRLTFEELVYLLEGQKDIAIIVWNVTKRKGKTPEEYRDQILSACENGCRTTGCLKAVDSLHNSDNFGDFKPEKKERKALEYIENCRILETSACFLSEDRKNSLLRVTAIIRENCLRVLNPV